MVEPLPSKYKPRLVWMWHNNNNNKNNNRLTTVLHCCGLASTLFLAAACNRALNRPAACVQLCTDQQHLAGICTAAAVNTLAALTLSLSLTWCCTSVLS